MTTSQKLNSISPLFDALSQAKVAIWEALRVPISFRGYGMRDLTDKVWRITNDDNILFGDPGEDLNSEAVVLEVYDYVRREHHVLVVTEDEDGDREMVVVALEREVRG